MERPPRIAKNLLPQRRPYALDEFHLHWLQLERALEGYRKDIQELNRLFALEDPRSKDRG
jgi:hypothetical protein